MSTHACVNDTRLVCISIDWEMPLHPLIQYMNSIAFHSIHKCRSAKSITQSSLCFDTWQCCCFCIKVRSYPLHKPLLWWNNLGVKNVEVFMFLLLCLTHKGVMDMVAALQWKCSSCLPQEMDLWSLVFYLTSIHCKINQMASEQRKNALVTGVVSGGEKTFLQKMLKGHM